MSTLAVYQMPAHGHINPTLPILSELVRQGERVIAYASRDMRAKITATGAEFREYPPLGFDHNDPPKNLGKMGRALLDFTGRVVPALIAEAQSERVRYVMHDSMATWGRAVASSLGLPSIGSTSTFALPAGLPASPKHAVIRLLFYAQGGARLPAIWREARQLGARYNMRRVGFRELFRNQADLNLVYTSDFFQPSAERLGPTYRFCGPSIPETFATDPALMAEIGERRLIYASLGTLFNARQDFFKSVLEALADFDGRVLLSIGQKLAPASFGRIPANAILRQSVPQIEVLKRTSLFLTHGGMNSVSEGLYFGVPQLVYPQAGDQMFVASRVAEMGAGLALREKDLVPARLRAIVHSVLDDPSFKENATRTGESLRTAGGYLEAVAQIAAWRERVSIRP